MYSTSFHELSLSIPLLKITDRVSIAERESAKEKFNIIHNAYSILTDSSKKKLYEKGCSVLFTKATVAAQWENYLKPVSSTDIIVAKKKYQGSLDEKNDLIREFEVGKGSMKHLLNSIPFMRMEDEFRIIEILKNLMDNGELRKMKIKRF